LCSPICPVAPYCCYFTHPTPSRHATPCHAMPCTSQFVTICYVSHMATSMEICPCVYQQLNDINVPTIRCHVKWCALVLRGMTSAWVGASATSAWMVVLSIGWCPCPTRRSGPCHCPSSTHCMSLPSATCWVSLYHTIRCHDDVFIAFALISMADDAVVKPMSGLRAHRGICRDCQIASGTTGRKVVPGQMTKSSNRYICTIGCLQWASWTSPSDECNED